LFILPDPPEHTKYVIGDCTWTYVFDPEVCGVKYLRFSVQPYPGGLLGNLRVTIQAADDTGLFGWYATVADFDCEAANEFELTATFPDIFDATCYGASTTCKVTALS
jgi:hypothetical protein